MTKSRGNDTENESSSSDDESWRQSCVKKLENLLVKGGKWENLSENEKKGLLPPKTPGGGDEQTALHILAEGFKQSKYYKADPDTLNTVIEYLLDNYEKPSHPLPHTKDFKRESPFLIVALKKNSQTIDKFIECVLKCCPSDERFAQLLDEQDDEGRNSLHQIFFVPSAEKQGGRRIRKRLVLDRARNYVKLAKPETIAAQDRDGNTPIHYAMHYLQCRERDDEWINIFKDMVNRGDRIIKQRNLEFNSQRESPIQYHNRTRDEEEEQNQKAKERSKTDTENQPKQTSSTKQTAYPKSKEEAPDLITEKIEARRLGLSREKGSEEPSYESYDKAGVFRGHDDPKIYKPTSRPQRKPQVPQSPTSGAFAGDKLSTEKGIPEGAWYPPSAAEAAIPNRGIRRTSTAQGLLKPSSDMPIRDDSSTASHNPPVQGSVQGDMPPPPPPSERQLDPGIEKMLEFLKLHYIRTRSDLKARELIYGKNSNAPDEQFYFDASGLDPKDCYPEQIVDLVEKTSIGGFHNTLSYVKLPTVVHTETPPVVKKTYGSKRKEENPKIGRTSLISVFDSLRDKGVKRILRLHVEDMDSPSHTDQAIIKALQGDRGRPISVETWDWRKPDLSTDVILEAAPSAEIVKLYWSGNHMVLKGWGSKEGIPRLKNLGHGSLKRVIIYASPGIETRERMDFVLKQFESDIREYMDGEDIVEIEPVMSGLRPCLDSKAETNASSRNIVSHQQHRWVDEMDQFMAALKKYIHPQLSAMKIKEPQRVKVALIDDGVDVFKLEYYDKIVKATGRSYCELTDGSENPWYSSTGGHGTIMANMIARINPWISLTVLKLPTATSLSNDGGYSFYPQWVANAIENAVDLKVDVIVMAWTLKSLDKTDLVGKTSVPGGGGGGTASGSGGPEERIKKAIDRARQEKILMFCSASDDITRNSKEFFPYMAAEDKNVMFRIGAADPVGQRDPRTEDTKHIDYFFPGNQVAERFNPRSGSTSEVKLHDGASVGTALAAGLASLIIYCTRIILSYCETRDSNTQSLMIDMHNYNQRTSVLDVHTLAANALTDIKTYRERANALKEMDKMRTALNNIFESVEEKKWEKEKYLPVWGSFGKGRNEIENAPDPKKLEKLMEMIGKLTYNIIAK